MASAEAIYILSRNNYNSFADKGNNIFFVRENSSETSDMVSLYVGEAKQTDVVIINGDDLWDSVTNNVNFGSNTVDYQVQGKLLLVEKEVPTVTDQQETEMKTVYCAMTYDSAQGKFIDCGIPNNVIVVGNDWSTSDTSVGVKDFIYIQKSTGAIYQFDGTQYVEVISPSTLDVDNVTIAKSAQNVISVIASGIADGSTITESSNTLKVNTSGIVDGTTTGVDSNGKIKAGINMTTGDLTTDTGNVVSSTDVPLATVIKGDSASSGELQYTYALPRNGGEERIGVGYTVSGNTTTVWSNSITNIVFNDIDHMRDENNNIISRADDYLSVIVVRKNSSAQDVSQFIDNFTDSSLPKIYLMNPDVDISGYTILHILLYYDGLNMCAIVTGYEE